MAIIGGDKLRQIPSIVLSNEEVMPGTYLLWADAPHIASACRPGQFVMVRTSDGYDPLLRRPFSIHRVRLEQGALALLFAVVGRGTNWLAQRKQGDMLDLLGPLGNGFEISPKSRSLLLVAGGIGISPLVFLAERGVAENRAVTMLSGAATASVLYPSHLLPSGVDTIVLTEDGSAGIKGAVTDFLPGLMAQADQVFACGPMQMYQTLADMSRKGMFKEKSLQVSLEVRMGCGMGMCYGCAIKTRNGMRLVCRDGPIFELRDILWEEI